LLRHDDEVVYGDAGYQGIEKRDEIVNNPRKSQIEYSINERPGKVRSLPEGPCRKREIEEKLSIKRKNILIQRFLSI